MRYPVFSVGETESHDAAHSVLNRAHSSLLDPTWHSALNESPPCDHRDPGLLYVTFTPANVGPTADDYLHAPLGYDQEFELCAENATRLGMEDLRSLAFELGVRLQELRGPPQICAPPRCTAP